MPKSWHNETWVCSLRGHRAPAAHAAVVRSEDRELGVELADGRRMSRCLRCDSWIDGWPPATGGAAYDVVPPLRELELPRRGKPLADAILLRLIAVNRAGHSLVFGILAIGLILVDTNIAHLKTWADGWLGRATSAAGTTTGDSSRDWLGRQLQRVAQLDRHAIAVLAATALAYCILEGVEGVGLWRERRWAEYLTAVATAGFLPFEIHELLLRITVVRVGALVINLAIIGYLVYAKRLFGARGGPLQAHDEVDWEAILSPPPRRSVSA